MPQECPDDSRLKRLLQADPGNADGTTLTHVEHCEWCQSRLELFCDQPLVDGWIDVLNSHSSDGRQSSHGFASRHGVLETIDRTGGVESTQADGASPRGQQQPSADASPTEPLPDLERYRVRREIGRGGMGVVYEAEHLDLGRRVAVKMLISGVLAGPERRSRFEREAKAIAKIDHPGIVQIFDVSEHKGVPYFALEYVEHGSLEDHLEGRPWNPNAAAEFVRQVAEGAHAAHELGFVHRDLKPANILVAKSPSSRSGWTPKITDFGLAKSDADTSLTRSGIAVGTPRYLSPEQVLGNESSVRVPSDVYAIGCILYELLSGRPPFQAETIADTLRQISENDPVDLRRLNPFVPDDLATICHKCLRKSPSARYGSAQGLAEDLQRFENQEPIHARPVSFAERSLKWARRRPVVAALLAIIAVILSVLAFVWIDFTRQLAGQTKIATDKAEEAERRAEEATEAADARSEMLRFFTQDLLQSVAPEEDGRNVTVFSVLKAADKEIEDRFVDRPQLSASIRMGIAESLEAIGEYREALHQAKKASELFQQVQGDDAEQTIEARILCVQLHATLSETNEAEAILAEIEQHVDKMDEESQLGVASVHASVMYSAGRYAEARDLHFTLYQKTLAFYGPDHEETLAELSNYACVMHEAGDLNGAQKLLSEYRDRILERYGPGHLKSLQATRTLGVSYAMTGRVKEALEMQEAGYEACRQVYGDDHPQATTALHNYAMALSRNKQYKKARPLLEQAVAESIARFGPNHETCVNYLGNLAYMHFEFGHVDRAAECLETFCDPIRDEAFDHPNWGVLLLTYGRVRQRRGELNAAKSLFEQSQGIFERSSGTTRLMTDTLAKSMERLAKQFEKRKSIDQAN